MLDRRLTGMRIRALGLAAITLSGCGAEQEGPSFLASESDVDPAGAPCSATGVLDAGVYARIRSVDASPGCNASVVTDADGNSAVAISDFVLQTSPKQRLAPGFCSQRNQGNDKWQQTSTSSNAFSRIRKTN